MTSIYLIRHGQASFGAEDYDKLSPLGEQQAMRLGQTLKQRLGGFDAVYLGSMLRHKQTAIHCLDTFGQRFEQYQPTVKAGFNEYDFQEILLAKNPSLSSAADITAEINQAPNPKQAFQEFFVSAIQRWIAGDNNDDYSESWEEFCERVDAAFKTVLNDTTGLKNVAVFTSGGPISLISQALIGVPKNNIMDMNWTLVNCGVTKVVNTGTRTFVSSLNEHTHFESEQHKHFITYT